MAIGATNYPAALDDADSLIRVANNVAATTTNEVGGAGANSTSGTTITVASTTVAPAFPASGTISIDAEVITYTSKTATTFTGCVRGADGTTAAAHTPAIGAVVNNYETALHHTVLANALIATQTKIGTGVSTPSAANTFMRGTGTGTTAWGSITVADMNTTLAATTTLLSVIGNAAGTAVFRVANVAAATVDMLTFDASATTNGLVTHVDKSGHLAFSQALVPTVAAGTGAGTGPTLTVVAGSTDQHGVVTVLTGTTPTGAFATIFTLTFRNPYATTPRVVMILPANFQAAPLTGTQQPFWTQAANTAGFSLTSGNTALAAAITYQWSYVVL